jgi:hypothetical protein
MSAPGFGVTMTCTAGYAPFLAAAIASLRRYNDRVPVRVLVDEGGAELLRKVADDLRMDLVCVRSENTGVYPNTGPNGEWIQSRLLKTTAIADAPFDLVLSLDSDILLCDDVAKIVDDLGDSLAAGADILMLPAPAGRSLWEGRKFYFVDTSIERGDAIKLINDVFELDMPVEHLDEPACSNSGVIFGVTSALRPVAERWRANFRRLFTAPRAVELVPRDQMALWVTRWQLQQQVRIAELPERWNFMAGHYLDLAAGTPAVDDARLGRAKILHLAWNKFDPWALERISAVLEDAGIPLSISLPFDASWPPPAETPGK